MVAWLPVVVHADSARHLGACILGLSFDSHHLWSYAVTTDEAQRVSVVRLQVHCRHFTCTSVLSARCCRCGASLPQDRPRWRLRPSWLSLSFPARHRVRPASQARSARHTADIQVHAVFAAEHPHVRLWECSDESLLGMPNMLADMRVACADSRHCLQWYW